MGNIVARTPRTLEEARWLDEEANVSCTVLVPLHVDPNDDAQWTVEPDTP